MNNNVTFNLTVCLLGILIFTIHIVNLIIKPNKRRDENTLLAFVSFTMFHFSVYLVYTIIKMNYTSNTFVVASYTTFYIFNNIQILLLFTYMMNYVVISKEKRYLMSVINALLFIIFITLDIINAFTGIFFKAEGGEYVRSRLMIVSQGYQFIMFIIIFLVTSFNEKLMLREKIVFGVYCIIPLIAIIIQNIYKGYAIAYASIIVSIQILFFFINVQRNLQISKQREKIKEAELKLMVSQIQPHFIYNSLSAISTLITIDPERAQSSLDTFTEYLRGNLASLTETRMLPFENELKHIKAYLSLEKLRFNDRLNVIYDIKSTDFKIPPLTIQPIVENACKHGILKKIDGGTITIRTYENDLNYYIEIIDDGVGFDTSKIELKHDHFDINNIKYRIEKMLNGDMIIDSKVDEGTKVTVTIAK